MPRTLRTAAFALATSLACASGDVPAPPDAIAPPPPVTVAPPAPMPPPEPVLEDVEIPDPPSGYGWRGVDHACAACVGTEGLLASVTASSSLKGSYGPENAFDGDPATAWCEGVAGHGVGESVTVRFVKPLLLDGAFFVGGYAKSTATLTQNGRLQEIVVTAGAPATVRLADAAVPAADPTFGEQTVPDEAEWLDRVRGFPALWDRHDDEAPISEVTLTIAAVYPGSTYEDTCVSELDLLVVDPAEL